VKLEGDKFSLSNRVENEWNILSEESSLKIINSFTLRKSLQKIHYLNFKENWIATFEIIVQVQGRVANPRPVASRKQSQTHSDANGLNCGDWSWMVTGQLVDTPTRGLPTRGLEDSRTGHVADWSTRRLDNSRTGQVAYWTTRGLADAAEKEN